MEGRRSMSLRSLTSNGDENTPTNGQPRRSDRKRTPSKQNEHIQALLSKTKRTPSKQTNIDKSNDQSEISYSEDEEHVDENMPHPNHLFDDKTDLAGCELYGFATPKKRDAMQNLVEKIPKTPVSLLKSMSLNSPHSPKTPKTPKTPKMSMSRTIALREKQNFSTPSETRNRNKEILHKRARKKVEETESESSADEHSDYEGEESTESSDEESGDATNDDDDNDNDEIDVPNGRKDTRKVPPIRIFAKTAKIITVQPTTRMTTRGRSKAKVHEDFVPDSDNYFISASNKKSKTSDHTLDRLKSSRLQHDELFNLLNSINASEEHQHKIAEMIHDLQLNFDRWMLEMSKGYNIIVYGSGSKQKLLHEFCDAHLADKPLLVVNGFFPSLTIKDLLQAIKVQILDISTNSRNDHEVVDLIASMLNSMPNGHVFLVINNIDGIMLRKTKDQHIISRLAKIKNLHLIASIDHINAPLMWDQTCMDNFNFVWYDCTTMVPYKNETAFENSVFFQNSGELDLAAMNNVFQSLTTNARGIYMVLAKNQMANKKDSNYQGMTFKDLYHKCRESFLVSSDSTLRTQLIEFVDHNMAKIKRSHDGTELVSIPISAHILLLFTQQQSE